VPQPSQVEGVAELLELCVPADKAREAPPRRSFQAGAGTRPNQFEHVHRLAESLDRHRAQRGDLDEPLGQLQRPGGEPDSAGRRELLHACRQVRGLAHGGVVHTEIAADRAHNNVAGVESDADLHLDALGAAKLVRVSPYAVLHSERGIARPHGVILVGERRAEQRHDAVTHDLVHRPLVAMDRLHHPFEHRIEQLARLLGIAVREHLHRALEVGEQDSDLLALTLQRGAGVDDPLGKVLRGVGLRRAEALRCLRRRRTRRMSALGAELGGRGKLGSAVGARACQGRRALLAELRPGAVLVLAPGTLHCRASSGPGRA
jgi:hypothetical protein